MGRISNMFFKISTVVVRQVSLARMGEMLSACFAVRLIEVAKQFVLIKKCSTCARDSCRGNENGSDMSVLVETVQSGFQNGP